eukprot:TRINITY_DN35386_c0_g1_i1.p1 TRINITY_DN35386_c0_g1~~TRINITY_DN35386_c0_g1_i1.p1  ORF type:complete len:288 (+),score=35.59 TRINITY_DN35386_c0_g1_i1:65-865(+)
MIVRLNVGGTQYMTLSSTLANAPSMLSNIVSEDFMHEKDENGAYFIDRDGRHFGEILNFLRDGSIFPPESVSACKLLAIEANYYGLTELYNALIDHLRHDQPIQAGVILSDKETTRMKVRENRVLGMPTSFNRESKISEIRIHIHPRRQQDGATITAMIVLGNDIVGKSQPIQVPENVEFVTAPLDEEVSVRATVTYYLAFKYLDPLDGMLSVPVCYDEEDEVQYTVLFEEERFFPRKKFGIIAIGRQQRHPDPRFDQILNRNLLK